MNQQQSQVAKLLEADTIYKALLKKYPHLEKQISKKDFVDTCLGKK